MKLRNVSLIAILMGMGLGLYTAPNQAHIFTKVAKGLARTKAVGSQVSSAAVNTVLFPKNHPFITCMAAAALGSTAYLVNCHKYSKDWKSVVEDAEDKTRYMFNPLDKPENLMYWQNESDKSGNWALAADIMANQSDVYNSLKKSQWVDDKSEHDFIVRMKTIIGKEKKDLMKVIKKLENCLDDCRILPRFELSPDQAAAQTNIVQSIIKDKKKSFNYSPNKNFIELSKDEAESINTDVMKRGLPSIFNPYLAVRNYALPFEARAIREYWRMYQLVQRLEALQYCLDQALQKLNIPNIPLCIKDEEAALLL